MRRTDTSMPKEMERQCAERMALLNSLMADGTITTPIEYLETPVLLVMSMSDDDLAYRHTRLMRTRRRGIEFHLNGRIFILPRKTAIALVRSEIAERQKNTCKRVL